MASSTRAVRKAELLDVSTKLFAARGFHGTRMDDVAEAANLNKATVYHYFASKALLLYDIYLRATDETLAIFQAVDEEETAADALRAYTTLTLALIARRPEQAAVYFLESPYLNEWLDEDQVKEIRSREHLFQEKVQGIIERGIRNGEFLECDSRIVALGYIGMTTGAYRWMQTRGRLSPDDISDEFADVFLRGLAQPSPRGDGPVGRRKSGRNNTRTAAPRRRASTQTS